MWHTWPLLRIGFPGWITEGKTDGGSAPAVSLKARGLARSQTHNRDTGAEEIGFYRDFESGVTDLGIQFQITVPWSLAHWKRSTRTSTASLNADSIHEPKWRFFPDPGTQVAH